jgi:8-amino-7-oxononanoate synthase
VANKADDEIVVDSLNDFLRNKLEQHSGKGLRRKLTTLENKIDFTSNDYLGLARSKELFNMIHQRVLETDQRNGSTGSRLLSGNSTYTEEVENRLAGIFECEHTLLFTSGYAANMAVLSSLPQKDDTIIYDEYAHACIKDGARLSVAKRFSFRHNDVNDLESKIRQATGRIYIVVESIYSMDGDECPLPALVKMKTQNPNLTLVVDEAHSTGVLGNDGSGFATSIGLAKHIDIRVHTFGKAMGVHGACVAGSSALREYLINFARPFIYTTAPPIHSVAGIDCAFQFLEHNLSLQADLINVINAYTKYAGRIRSTTNSRSAIQTVIIPGSELTRAAATKLQAKGFDVRPILSPTVPVGKERLRICLHTYNSEEEIVRLCGQLNELMESNGLQ